MFVWLSASWLIPLIPLSAAVMLLVLDERRPVLVRWITQAAAAATLLLSAAAAVALSQAPRLRYEAALAEWMPGANWGVRLNPMSLAGLLLVSLGGVWLAARREPNPYRQFFLCFLLLAILGGDSLLVFACVVCAGLCGYALLLIERSRAYVVAAALVAPMVWRGWI